jgi:hypothetical protein
LSVHRLDRRASSGSRGRTPSCSRLTDLVGSRDAHVDALVSLQVAVQPRNQPEEAKPGWCSTVTVRDGNASRASSASCRPVLQDLLRHLCRGPGPFRSAAGRACGARSSLPPKALLQALDLPAHRRLGQGQFLPALVNERWRAAASKAAATPGRYLPVRVMHA